MFQKPAPTPCTPHQAEKRFIVKRHDAVDKQRARPVQRKRDAKYAERVEVPQVPGRRPVVPLVFVVAGRPVIRLDGPLHQMRAKRSDPTADSADHQPHQIVRKNREPVLVNIHLGRRRRRSDSVLGARRTEANAPTAPGMPRRKRRPLRLGAAAVKKTAFRVDRFRDAAPMRVDVCCVPGVIERAARMDGGAQHEPNESARQSVVDTRKLGETTANRVQHRMILTRSQAEQRITRLGIPVPAKKCAVTNGRDRGLAGVNLRTGACVYILAVFG